MASTEQVAKLAKDNLFLIFGEGSKDKRFVQYEKLWQPSGEILFLEPGARCTTYEDMDAIIVGLQKMGSGFVFEMIGDVQILAANGDETIARLKWGNGPLGKDYVVTGEDVFTIVGGKIKTLYTFLD